MLFINELINFGLNWYKFVVGLFGFIITFPADVIYSCIIIRANKSYYDNRDKLLPESNSSTYEADGSKIRI